MYTSYLGEPIEISRKDLEGEIDLFSKLLGERGWQDVASSDIPNEVLEDVLTGKLQERHKDDDEINLKEAEWNEAYDNLPLRSSYEFGYFTRDVIGRAWLSRIYNEEKLIEGGKNLHYTLPFINGKNAFGKASVDNKTLKDLYIGNGNVDIELCKRDFEDALEDKLDLQRYGEIVKIVYYGKGIYFRSSPDEVEKALELLGIKPLGEIDHKNLNEFIHYSLLVESFRMETQLHEAMVEKGYERPFAYNW